MAARDIIQAAAGAAGATEANYIEDVFSTYLYTGNNTARTITNGIDLSTKGGMVWFKSRSSITNNAIFDTPRGPNSYLVTNSTNANVFNNTYPTLTSFNTDGFSLGADLTAYSVNDGGRTYASWTFRKQAKFFDVVTYTGTGSARTISHALGATPGMIIIKRTDSTSHWFTYHRSLQSSGSGPYHLLLNFTQAENDGGLFGSAPTSSVFSVASSLSVSGSTYVAYLFADSNSGGFGASGTDSVVACGSYTGNGSASGPAVTLGWEPQYVMIKMVSSTGDWNIFDNMRGIATGSDDPYLFANTSAEEATTNGDLIDLTPTGFVIKSTNAEVNTSGGTYIYLAIRRGPMKTPTDATKVFAPVLASGNGVGTTGFPVDTFFVRAKAGGGAGLVNDRLRGSGSSLYTTGTSAEDTGFNTYFDNNTGVNNQTSFPNPISWNFRRAPGFFDVVCYTGNDGNPQTVSHNLTVVPEMVIGKARSGTSSWYVYHSGIGNTKSLRLQVTGAAIGPDSGYWGNTTPTATNIYPGNTQTVGGTTYVAYLFATCPGVSKVGSYTGSGTTKQIDCGFAAGARFVLIKRTDSTGDWYVWDTARGIVSGNDPYLLLNSTAAEVTSTDYIDPYSAGFEISSTAPAEINASGGTYIYLAIA